MLDVLEAVGINGRSTSEAITEKSGYDKWAVQRAIRFLHMRGCVARLGLKARCTRSPSAGRLRWLSGVVDSIERSSASERPDVAAPASSET
jgi:hypothetical protein